MNFNAIITKYRSESFSERNKGARFEKLMVNFLKTYQVYDQKFSKVWLWREWPLHWELNPQDIGIDLVAEAEDSQLWAVQCKCFKEDAYVDKSEVDSFLGASGKRFKDQDGQWRKFSHRLWISTTNKWSSLAEKEIHNQIVPFNRLNLIDLESAAVDWGKLDQGDFGSKARLQRKNLLEHQRTALDKFHEHFKTQDRGQLIMACGTGKSLTSLKIAEKETNGRGLVLFFAPSIALISQLLLEWSNNASKPLFSICVCSDPDVSRVKRKNDQDEPMESEADLALPATTSVTNIIKQLNFAQTHHSKQLHVIFSTYQSIDKVAEALKKAKLTADLIVCDEAHRTTGVTLIGEDESHFVKVHDNSFIKANKRLYMTATPRIYAESLKKRAEEFFATFCSMDDEALFGPEVYRLGFGESVDRALLSDYKVLVLTVKRSEITDKIQKELTEGQKEIDTDDITKLFGCLNALSKNMAMEGQVLRQVDPGPMFKAVAFCQTIAKSKKITEVFNQIKKKYCHGMTPKELGSLVNVSADHIDGSMGASLRDKKMSWLREKSSDDQECRILTNVRCLSEGVDVPSLDAVLFLSAKNSQIEVVQSVGRVMRKAEGKKFGYIIIPVVVPTYVEPEDALNDNERFKVVWTVLNALKAHDDRFNALINKIQFNKSIPLDGGSVLIGGIAHGESSVLKGPTPDDLLTVLQPSEPELYRAIYARLVKKVGFKQDMLLWAHDVAKIADGFKTRITKVVNQKGPHKEEFDRFHEGLKKTLNPSVDAAEAIEMLAQHLITKPVFEALFENYSFVQNNPVSKSLETMIEVLEDQGLEKDKITLSRFYQTVKEEVTGIDTPDARQRIIVKLYDNFFKIATPKAVEKLGIVYTPVEIVDFINHSVAKALKEEFNLEFTDENVHIMDPFTGTGTFITRLIQSGLLGQGDVLTKKYFNCLHANEIVLLAYYIASINIESTYYNVIGEIKDYQPFNGICLADTFQLYEKKDSDLLKDQRLKKNTERVNNQKNTKIMLIIGNPPYSIGQGDTNKNAKNQSYQILDARISSTYSDSSSATNKNSLYDSYIKAFRWSIDRLDENNGGIIGFVTNAGWLDGMAMDGMRKSLVNEFSSIYVFNLRGNCRTQGEQRRKEKDNVFGLGSRTPVAITILIKNPKETGPANIYYHDIGDYLSRSDKLELITKFNDIYNHEMAWKKIIPNAVGDWLNQRSELFSEFIIIGDKDNKNNLKTIFYYNYSHGVGTSRDSWCYNYSIKCLKKNINYTIDFYNTQRNHFHNQNKINKVENFINRDSTKISWSRSLINFLQSNQAAIFNSNNVNTSLYRPFNKQFLYYDKIFNHYISKIPKLFPTPIHENLLICVSGIGGTKDNTTLISNCIPDLNCLDAGTQCFPRYYFEPVDEKQNTLFTQAIGGYTRHDAITDYILKECRHKYGPKVTKDQIFYYVYGLLHSKDYREAFDSDLKKMLPRIPLVDKAEDFDAFFKAGKALAKLHLNYETVTPYPKVNISGLEKGNFLVDKIRFVDKKDKSVIQYNSNIRITEIPLEAYEYVVNGRSAIEWILERYQVKVDKDSGIKNDPNDWAREQKEPQYILDLLLRVITVSLETMKIVNQLPKLEF